MNPTRVTATWIQTFCGGRDVLDGEVEAAPLVGGVVASLRYWTDTQVIAAARRRLLEEHPKLIEAVGHRSPHVDSGSRLAYPFIVGHR